MQSPRHLTSFIARNNDFEGPPGSTLVNPQGPTVQYHQHFWDAPDITSTRYTRHLVLGATEEDHAPAVKLAGYLTHFLGHEAEAYCLNIQDVLDLAETKDALQQLLLQKPGLPWDFFFSPGNSIMQLSWYICHTSLKLDSRLVQTRAARFSNDQKPHWIEIPAVRDPVPTHMALRQATQKPSRLNGAPSSEGEAVFFSAKVLAPVYALARQIGEAGKVTVLINGETGTGKENLAGTVHEMSLRGHQKKPFHSLNCSALGDQLLESRLFGYVKGAFTDAHRDTPGIIEKTDGGTLFLDEIGDISPYMQRALLRFLQEGEILRVGSDHPQKVDVRVIAATHRDLFSECLEGRFRWDLYYRLAVAELELPPLREWPPEDRQGLFDFFLQHKQKQFKRETGLDIEAETYQYLANQHHYPGNIREMENLVEGMYAMHNQRKVSWEDLPRRIRQRQNNQQEVPDELHDLLAWKAYHLSQQCASLKEATQRMGVSENSFRKYLRHYQEGDHP